ncbi:MAG: hypothetical protein EXS41_04055 [Opitutaceae bacterium]|nr:hypothetical protein [Opitutaceae bacterium]
MNNGLVMKCAGNNGHGGASPRAAIEQAIVKLDGLRPTVIESHPGRCCLLAREWFCAQSRAHHEVSGLPAPWLRERWMWGPQHHPDYWCEVVERTTIDCSALAALTCESLRAIGEPVATVQMIEHFDPSTVQNWAHYWREHGGAYWLSGSTSYHVAVAVRAPGSPGIRIWNPTVECFSEQRPLAGYGSIAAVRMLVDADSGLAPGGAFAWRGLHLRANDWNIVSL